MPLAPRFSCPSSQRFAPASFDQQALIKPSQRQLHPKTVLIQLIILLREQSLLSLKTVPLVHLIILLSLISRSPTIKGSDPDLIEHVVPMVAAFDTATAFALSFGIAKFQLAQKEAKLIGEYVGREGRRPNPQIVQAIRNWPAINELKHLQSFLGTTNHARAHAGPAYARVLAGVRALLKPGAEFPPNFHLLHQGECKQGRIIYMEEAKEGYIILTFIRFIN